MTIKTCVAVSAKLFSCETEWSNVQVALKYLNQFRLCLLCGSCLNEAKLGLLPPGPKQQWVNLLVKGLPIQHSLLPCITISPFDYLTSPWSSSFHPLQTLASCQWVTNLMCMTYASVCVMWRLLSCMSFTKSYFLLITSSLLWLSVVNAQRVCIQF